MPGSGGNNTVIVDFIMRRGPSTDLTEDDLSAPRPMFLTDSNEFIVSRGDGTYENISREISELMSDLHYTPVNISSVAVSPPSAERGSSVATLTVTFNINKVPNTLKVDGVTKTPASSGSVALSGPFTQDKTVSVVATDNGSASDPTTHTSTKSATLKFYNRIYYGVGANVDPITDSFLRGLANSPLSDTKGRTITLAPGANQYIWYAVPKRLGTCKFVVGGFEGGFELIDTFNHLNASGYREDYYVYRSSNPNLGSTTVVVS